MIFHRTPFGLLCTAKGEIVVFSASNRATNGSRPYPGAEAPRWLADLPHCEGRQQSDPMPLEQRLRSHREPELVADASLSDLALKRQDVGCTTA